MSIYFDDYNLLIPYEELAKIGSPKYIKIRQDGSKITISQTTRDDVNAIDVPENKSIFPGYLTVPYFDSKGSNYLRDTKVETSNNIIADLKKTGCPGNIKEAAFIVPLIVQKKGRLAIRNLLNDGIRDIQNKNTRPFAQAIDDIKDGRLD